MAVTGRNRRKRIASATVKPALPFPLVAAENAADSKLTIR